MCGIAGFTGSPNEQVARRMAKALEHRGKDNEDIWVSPDVTLTFRRLAIQDLTVAGQQPMTSHDGLATIVFNGEIYNAPALRKELKGLGVAFRGHSDTEVVLEGYRQWGEACFERLRGMWAFAIADRERNEVTLGRDPFGIKPLVYGFNASGHLCFASELKALRVIPGLAAEMDVRALHAYVVLGYVPAPLTVWKGCRKAFPGEIIRYRHVDKTVRKRRIWFPIATPESSDVPTMVQATTACESVLMESIDAHFLSDVPVGLFLSGGRDSTLIALLAHKAGRKPHAYHMAVAGSGDTAWARRVAKSLSLPYTEFVFSDDEVREMYDEVWRTIDEPFADPSIFPTLLLARHASRDVKVVLSGEGGDELFGGYFQHRRLDGIKGAAMPDGGFRVLDRLSKPQTMLGHRLIIPSLRRLALYWKRYIVPDGLGTYLLLLEQSALSSQLGPVYELLKEQTMVYGHSGLPFLYDEAIFLPNDLLYRIDIATMHYTLEARTPLLDRQVLQWATSLPNSLRNSKRILDAVLAKNGFEDLTRRGKVGFSFPLRSLLFETYRQDVDIALKAASGEAIQLALPSVFLKRLATEQEFRSLIERKYPRLIYSLLVWAKMMHGT